MGIFRRADSPNWWYRVQLDGRVMTGSTNTSDKRLAERICLEKSHQLAEVIFSKAVRWGYAARNPIKEVELFKEETTPVRLLTPEERRRILEASPEFLKPIVTMALKTGMRQGEIIALEWRDVDLNQDIINVRRTKGKKLRQIPIHPELKRVLERLPRKSPHVFCNSAGERFHRNGIVREAFEKVREDCLRARRQLPNTRLVPLGAIFTRGGR